MPAMLPSTSRPPNCSTVAATDAMHSSRLLMSPARVVRVAPASATSLAVSASASALRSCARMSAPSDARRSVTARPMPDPAPVISATFPSKRASAMVPPGAIGCGAVSARAVPYPSMSGPLTGVKVVELAGLGALPFGTLKLADMGADVIRVDRAGEVPATPPDPPKGFSEWDRGRRSIGVDLKHPDGVEVVLRLAERADALLESFRPGVAERLGVGPDVALARNPKLVYGRLTGWGQDGPLAPFAGHSLNYEAITGAIGSIGSAGQPPVPLLQVLGDFGGGGLHLAYGVVCALFEGQRSGKGQV